MEADVGNDIVTSLRSDLAGLQYKRDKLISEVSHDNTQIFVIFICKKKVKHFVYWFDSYSINVLIAEQ